MYETCDPPHCPFSQRIDPRQRVGLTAWSRPLARRSARAITTSSRGIVIIAVNSTVRTSREGNSAALGSVYPYGVGGLITGVLKIETCRRRAFPTGALPPEIRQRSTCWLKRSPLRSNASNTRVRHATKVMYRAMPTILEILRGDRDIPALVKHVVEKTAELFDARACSLFLKEGNQLIQPQWAAVGWATAGPNVRRYDLVPPEQITDAPADIREEGRPYGLDRGQQNALHCEKAIWSWFPTRTIAVSLTLTTSKRENVVSPSWASRC